MSGALKNVAHRDGNIMGIMRTVTNKILEYQHNDGIYIEVGCLKCMDDHIHGALKHVSESNP